MPRSSWGTKTKIDKNKWRIRWCEWDGMNRVRRSKTLYPCTSREADDELRRLWQLHHLPPNERVVPCPTFAQCWDEWYFPELKERLERGEIAANTLKNYMNMWSIYIEKKWSGVALDKVDVSEYQTWLKMLAPSCAELSNITVGNMVTCAKLHGVKGITFKDVQYKMPKRNTATSNELDVYTLDELHKLIESAKGSRIESILILMGKGSCRTGEAVAAAIKDMEYIEQNGRTYAIYNLYRQYGACNSEFSSLKTASSTRPIIVPEPWSIRLKEIAEQRRADDELFLSDNGTGIPMSRPTISRDYKKLFAQNGIRKLSLSKLRNSWATAMLWKYNVPAQMVDKMMGHAAQNILGKHYDKPDRDMFIEEIERVYFGN